MEIFLNYFILFCAFQMIVSGIQTFIKCHPIMTAFMGIFNAILISFGLTLLMYLLKVV